MFKQFTALSGKEQRELNRRYILPTDLTNLVVSVANNIPCEIIGGAKVACTVNTKLLIAEGFHNSKLRINS